MTFNTAYKRAVKPETLPVGKRIVDTTGYISPNVRINTMIAAGEQLVAFRDEQATILNEIYGDDRALPYNPSLLDMLEINSLTSKRAKAALERIQRAKEETEKAYAEKIAQQAAEGSPEPKNSKDETSENTPQAK